MTIRGAWLLLSFCVVPACVQAPDDTSGDPMFPAYPALGPMPAPPVASGPTMFTGELDGAAWTVDADSAGLQVVSHGSNATAMYFTHHLTPAPGVEQLYLEVDSPVPPVRTTYELSGATNHAIYSTNALGPIVMSTAKPGNPCTLVIAEVVPADQVFTGAFRCELLHLNESVVAQRFRGAFRFHY